MLSALSFTEGKAPHKCPHFFFTFRCSVTVHLHVHNKLNLSYLLPKRNEGEKNIL